MHIIDLIIEQPTTSPTNHKPRILEYECEITKTNTAPGYKIRIRRITDLTNQRLIYKTNRNTTDQHLPPTTQIEEAARLYDWSYHNQTVFSHGRTTPKETNTP